jgi:hypothetical protein
MTRLRTGTVFLLLLLSILLLFTLSTKYYSLWGPRRARRLYNTYIYMHTFDFVHNIRILLLYYQLNSLDVELLVYRKNCILIGNSIRIIMGTLCDTAALPDRAKDLTTAEFPPVNLLKRSGLELTTYVFDIVRWQ